MKIYLAADHGGFSLKEEIKEILLELPSLAGSSVELIDLGAKSFIADDDYPDFVLSLPKNFNDLAFLFCRSGSGMVMAANKVKGVRAVDVYSKKIARHSVEHNHANVFAFGADYLSKAQVIQFLETIFTSQPSLAPRHLRRIQKITDYEA